MSQSKTIILHETDNGYIAKCSCCNKFKIAFGNIILRYDEFGFKSFKECIEGIDTEHCDQGSDQRRYGLKLPCEVSMRFSRNEILELKELLDWADASLQVNHELFD